MAKKAETSVPENEVVFSYYGSDAKLPET